MLWKYKFTGNENLLKMPMHWTHKCTEYASPLRLHMNWNTIAFAVQIQLAWKWKCSENAAAHFGWWQKVMTTIRNMTYLTGVTGTWVTRRWLEGREGEVQLLITWIRNRRRGRMRERRRRRRRRRRRELKTKIPFIKIPIYNKKFSLYALLFE